MPTTTKKYPCLVFLTARAKIHTRPHDFHRQANSTIMEEKDDGLDPAATNGIANVGVAVALREACAAHPELVQTHGPLSAPILRAMLGLDPSKTARQDDAQALSVAAKAVALARGFSRSESTTAGGGGMEGNPRAPPSPSRMSHSSSSSSELSTSEEEGERLGRKGSNASAATATNRVRLSSWLGQGSKHGRMMTSESAHSYHQQHMMFQQQQQQLMFQQQQQMQLHYHLQQQQQQQQRSGQEGGAAPADGSIGFNPHGGPAPAAALMGGSSHHGGPLFAGGYVGAPYSGVGAVGAYGLAVPPAAAFEPSGGSSSRTLPTSASSHSKRSSSAGKSKSGRRGRSRSSRHRRSSSSGGDIIVPPAVEEFERPVLRSFASGGGSQHDIQSAAGTPASSAGAGFSVTHGSGRSLPFSSSHRAARAGPRERGTPGRPLRRTQSHTSDAGSVDVAPAAKPAVVTLTMPGHVDAAIRGSDSTAVGSTASGEAEAIAVDRKGSNAE